MVCDDGSIFMKCLNLPEGSHESDPQRNTWVVYRRVRKVKEHFRRVTKFLNLLTLKATRWF